MRKTVLLAALLVLAMFVVTPAFAELELGLSWTPVPNEDPNADVQLESITGFHVAYKWWGIFYASVESLVMPPDSINDLVGVPRPGFLNLMGLGLRLRLGPIIAYTTAGVNSIYVYKQAELEDQLDPGVGANLRVGAGLKFNWWGVNVSGTSVFSSFDSLANTLSGLADPNTQEIALQRIIENLIPSINLTLYF